MSVATNEHYVKKCECIFLYTLLDWHFLFPQLFLGIFNKNQTSSYLYNISSIPYANVLK